MWKSPPIRGDIFLNRVRTCFHLVLAASNCSPRPFTIEVWSSGRRSETQEEMFDTGFKTREL
jgi:hypothetical protein